MRQTDAVLVDVVDITDPDDSRVDDFRDLNSADRRPDVPALPGGRAGRGLVIAEGVLVVRRMIASRFTPHAFLGVDKRLHELAASLEKTTEASGVPFYRASADVMATVIGFHLNRGVLGAARRPESLDVREIAATASTVVILEGVNDHENIGGIFRNAAGLGVDAVVFGQGCADPLYRRSVRVSMGHVLLIPFAHVTQWPDDLEVLRDNGFQLIALTPGEVAIPLADAVHGEKAAFMVGAEGPGLTETAMRAADVRARIPMSLGTDSLNVATSAAIAFYERARG